MIYTRRIRFVQQVKCEVMRKRKYSSLVATSNMLNRIRVKYAKNTQNILDLMKNILAKEKNIDKSANYGFSFKNVLRKYE